MASGTHWKCRGPVQCSLYKVFFLYLVLFVPAWSTSLRGLLVSASGNNAFKADFIRWTPRRKAFKAALKENVSSYQAYGVYAFMWVWRGSGQGVMFSFIKQALHFRHHAIQGTFSNCAEREVVAQGDACGIKMNGRQDWLLHLDISGGTSWF